MNRLLRATYRIQFHKDYTLYDAVCLVPYLEKLGISHIYASPLLASVPGSMHGYDTIDWNCIDPERGGEAGLKALVNVLHAHNMGLILDIVPNHMSTNHHNLWWQNVLQYGSKSKYADYFDIDWAISQTQKTHRIILPFLEKPLSDILKEKKIRFLHNDKTKSFIIAYEDKIFPVSLESMDWVVSRPGFENAENLTFHSKKLLTDFFSPETSEGRQNLLLLLQKHIINWFGGVMQVTW